MYVFVLSDAYNNLLLHKNFSLHHANGNEMHNAMFPQLFVELVCFHSFVLVVHDIHTADAYLHNV